jgi:hypothetical protein
MLIAAGAGRAIYSRWHSAKRQEFGKHSVNILAIFVCMPALPPKPHNGIKSLLIHTKIWEKTGIMSTKKCCQRFVGVGGFLGKKVL